jgi:Zn-dependent protease with chaperone function
MAPVFFNLFTNATFSLLIGLAVVFGCIRLLRVGHGPWKLFLLSLPFVKVIYDFARGVPRSSILLTNIDPYSLPPGVQNFTIGLGLNNFGPQLKALFTIKDFFGNEYGASIGDYVVYWIARKFGYELPGHLVDAVLLIALVLLLRRLYLGLKFEWQRRRDRLQARSFQTLTHYFRKIDIYVSESYAGSPFTGGVLKPYICIPQETAEKLTPEELNAVIAHELGHVRQFDVLVTVFICAVGDLFWFVPGYRWLGRRLERLRELIADQRALRSGASAGDLASALIKLKEMSFEPNSMNTCVAFFREKSLLKMRIENLLGTLDREPPRWLWRNFWGRLLITFWLIGAVLNSNLGGNHATRSPFADGSVSIFSGSDEPRS